jgi:hypothetical protein
MGYERSLESAGGAELLPPGGRADNASALINAFLAFLYNLAADIFGGLEMTFVERDV